MKPIMHLHSCRPFKTETVPLKVRQADADLRADRRMLPFYCRLLRLRNSRRWQDYEWAEWMFARAGLTSENDKRILHEFLGGETDVKLSQC